MRRLRRFAIALLGVLLLPVTPLGAGASCSASAGRPAASAPPAVAGVVGADAPPLDHAAQGHAGHAEQSRAPAPDVPRPGHEPGPPHHGGDVSCPASAACASVAVAGRTPELADAGAPAASRLAALHVAAPASVVGPPEPPPPRVVRA